MGATARARSELFLVSSFVAAACVIFTLAAPRLAFCVACSLDGPARVLPLPPASPHLRATRRHRRWREENRRRRRRRRETLDVKPAQAACCITSSLLPACCVTFCRFHACLFIFIFLAHGDTRVGSLHFELDDAF